MSSVLGHPQKPMLSRNASIVVGVLVFHAAILWLAQSGLLRRAVETIVPVEVLSEMIDPPKPQIEPPKPPPQPKIAPRPVQKTTVPPPPLPVAIKDDTPAVNAPTGATTPQPPPPPSPVIAQAPAAPPAPPRPPRLTFPRPPPTTCKTRSHLIRRSASASENRES